MGKPILDTHELAWAAGFFDGEGSTSIRKRGDWCELVIQVAQSEPHTLNRFKNAVLGLGQVNGPYYHRNPAYLPRYSFCVRGYVDAQAVLALLWKYMSLPKRDQAHAAMLECKFYLDNRPGGLKGVSKLSPIERARLQERARLARRNRIRLPKGWLAKESANLGISIEAIENILRS